MLWFVKSATMNSKVELLEAQTKQQKKWLQDFQIILKL